MVPALAGDYPVRIAGDVAIGQEKGAARSSTDAGFKRMPSLRRTNES